MPAPLAILGALAVSALVLWLALVAMLVVLFPRGVDLAEAKRFVPDVINLLRRLARDPTAGRQIRWRVLILLAYLASPVDLVPDFVPIVGYADDVVVLAFVLRSVVRRAGGTVVTANWGGTPGGLAVIRKLAGLSVP